MEENTVKCILTLNRQIFPSKPLANGDFGIVSFKVEEVLEGELGTFGNNIVVKGNLCELEYGVKYKMTGRLVDDDRYGKQFESIYFNRDINLTSKDAQKLFLKNILTDTQLDNLYNTLEDPMEAIKEKDIEALCQVKGIGASIASKILDRYEDTKDYSSAFIELDRLGLTSQTIKRLSDSFGGADILVSKIKENPYILIEEADGIGWEKADSIALKNGCGEQSIYRVKAFITYYLKQLGENGDTYSHSDDFFIEIDDMFGEELQQETLTGALKELVDEKKVYISNNRDIIALSQYFTLESFIAFNIMRLKNSPIASFPEDWESRVKDRENEQGWKFTDEQWKGIESALLNNVTLITAPAGCGKTATVSGVLSALGLSPQEIAQCALSGKASVNLTEATGLEGYTIHKLLQYNPRTGFGYNYTNPLEHEVVILDELSMVGADLFCKLVQSVANGSKLIMLGDIGQLEAIGAGNVIYDLIESGAINVVTLTKIHRQAQKSAIITESLKVRNGEDITDKNQNGTKVLGELKDLKMEVYNDKAFTFHKIMENFKELYPTVDNIMDIQVIVPMKERGSSCTYAINQAIQEWLMEDTRTGFNKKACSKIDIKPNSKFPYTLYMGDKVMNVKNNYETVSPNGKTVPIMNGNMGIVTFIDEVNGTMIVDFEFLGEVIIPKKQMEHIILGYAITVHKSQGSGFKVLICGLDYSHYTQCNRGMVYTMLTRAKQYCVLCVENKALRYAISNDTSRKKNTFLSGFLKHHLKKEKENK